MAMASPTWLTSSLARTYWVRGEVRAGQAVVLAGAALDIGSGPQPQDRGPAAVPDDADSADGAGESSGDGAYRGTEPPEGYVIKGNERSMKYHLPDSDGYVRTIAEVWFNSEEAAERAGFLRARG